MAVRNFNGTSDQITLAVGGLATQTGGNLTMAVLMNRQAGSWAAAMSINGTGSTQLISQAFDSADRGYFFTDTGAETWSPVGLTYPASDNWVLYAVTKASGTVAPRFHKYVFDTSTWTHSASGETALNGAAPGASGNVKIGAKDTGFDFFNGRLALAGIFPTVLSDATLEGMTTQLQAWVDAGPTGLWPLNQTSTATPVDDIVGTSDQTAISGTTVVTGDDPPGFSFTLGPLPPLSKPARLVRRVTWHARRVFTQAIWSTVAVPAAGTAPTIVAVNEVTETDISNTLTRIKTRTVGQCIETDVSQTTIHRKTKIIGQVTETDVSQPTNKVKTRLIGQANETDVSRPVSTPPKINRAIETDAAQPIARLKSRLIGQVTGTSTSQPLTRLKRKVVGQPTETSTSQAISEQKKRTIQQSIETNIAQIIISGIRTGTQLHLTNVNAEAGVTVGVGTRHRFHWDAGQSAIVRNKNTVAGPTAPLQITDSSTPGTDGTAVSWYSNQLESVTISGAITIELWAEESGG